MSYCANCGRSLQDTAHTCPSCGGTVIPDAPAGRSDPLYPAGALLDGRFRVQETLGSGSAGVVYGVADELLDRMDAILAEKRAKAAYDPTTRAFLPITLYRDAVMHRDAGDRKEARALLAEARRLAPES